MTCGEGFGRFVGIRSVIAVRFFRDTTDDDSNNGNLGRTRIDMKRAISARRQLPEIFVECSIWIISLIMVISNISTFMRAYITPLFSATSACFRVSIRAIHLRPIRSLLLRMQIKLLKTTAAVVASMCFGGSVHSDNVVTLDTLNPGLREMFDYFVSGEPEVYDYTISNIVTGDSDIGNWCINNASNLFSNVIAGKYSTDLLNSCIDDMHSELLSIADSEIERIRSIMESGEVMEKYNGMVPAKKVRTGVYRVRRNGDNYRLDSVPDMYLHGRIDPEAYGWIKTTGYYYDENMMYRQWDKDYIDRYASIRPSKKQIMGFMEWRAFRMDNEVMQSLMWLVADTTETNVWIPKSLRKLIRKQAPFSESDFLVNDEKIEQLIDGTHDDVLVRASTVGADENVILIDFLYRNATNGSAFLSMVFGKDNITKPYIVVRRDPDSTINHCSLRSYYDNGEVCHYALLKKENRNKIKVRLMTFLTELLHVNPTSDVFKFIVPDRWSYLDLVNVSESEATLYKSNGETQTVKIVGLDDPLHPRNSRNHPKNTRSFENIPRTVVRIVMIGVLAVAFISIITFYKFMNNVRRKEPK